LKPNPKGDELLVRAKIGGTLLGLLPCFRGKNGQISDQKREKEGTSLRFSGILMSHEIRFSLYFQWLNSTISQFHRGGGWGYALFEPSFGAI
jgi:hypothetical protein